MPKLPYETPTLTLETVPPQADYIPERWLRYQAQMKRVEGQRRIFSAALAGCVCIAGLSVLALISVRGL